MGTDGIRVAVIQEPPVFLDLEATLARAIKHLAAAAGEGARLVVFPETYLPGYPDWVWRVSPGSNANVELHQRLVEQSVDLETAALAPLQHAAAEHDVVVVCGLHERDGRFSRKTIFNTLVTIGPNGEILNRHRKLMPTNPERMVWAPGDATGLRVVDTPIGRLGSLICWENYMPLSRFTLYADGVQVYVAPTWDEGDIWIASMQHIAREGACWVIGAGCSVHARDIPADFPRRDTIYTEDTWLNAGDSVVVSPDGEIVAGPLRQQHGIMYADIDRAATARMGRTLDVAGHYARPDVFHLSVDRGAREPIS